MPDYISIPVAMVATYLAAVGFRFLFFTPPEAMSDKEAAEYDKAVKLRQTANTNREQSKC